MKKNFSLISSMASILILFLTLIISVSYAWYTNNKEVQSTGIASTASDSISILNQGIYKKVIGEDPFPDNDKSNQVDGVLSGDIIYYSVSIALSDSKKKDINYDINIGVLNINGGEYFVAPAIKVLEEPAGVSTNEFYEFDGDEYRLFNIDGNKYFIVTEEGNRYIYYLYESASGEILTKKPQLIFPKPTGTLTGTLFEFDGGKYATYLDENGKEYFLTYDVTIIDGVEHIKATYVNYIYEEIVNGETIRYNMCDVYTIGIFKVFGVDHQGNTTTLVNNEESLVLNSIDKASGLDKEVESYNLYDYEGWDPSMYKEIIFTFAIKFDYSEFEGRINTNCVSNKELIFKNVVITDTESEVSE